MVELTWDPALFAYRMKSGCDLTFDERDSSLFMLNCTVVDPNFDWTGLEPETIVSLVRRSVRTWNCRRSGPAGPEHSWRFPI
jgi:hypothetical protein